MLRFLKGKVSERKLRLVAVAVHREYHRLDPRFSRPESSLAVDKAEAIAETSSSVDNATRSRLGGYFILNPTAYGAATRLVDNSDVPDDFKCGILRCIFGPLPFRPVALDTSICLSHGGKVVKLAQAIYNDRAFARLLILADALEEAGCTNEEILVHLRGPGPHVRGCWPLDLLLDKE
jgi:hypothetical protein